jgi:hypothetical protein
MTTARNTLSEANKAAPAVGIRLDRTVRLTVTELHQLLDYVQHCENEGWYWGNKAQFRKRHDKLKAWLNAQVDLKTSRPTLELSGRRRYSGDCPLERKVRPQRTGESR